MNSQSAIQTYKFQSAGTIVAGSNSILTLPEQLKLVCEVRSVLMVTSESMIKHGYTDEILQQLKSKGIFVTVMTGVMQEPTVQNMKELFSKIEAEQFDVMIGMGGGSVLDATKILSVMKTNSVPLETMIGTDLVEASGIPVVLIPTTSGTGSEVTPNAIITLPDEELKVGIVSRHLLPKLAILDPALTLTLPKSITAATGMDAFTHAFESFISNKANPISDMFALEGIRKISQSIVGAYHNGSSLMEREKMLIGSMYGGMALTSAGTAAVHALAYPLGGKFHVTHGVANSMLLPHVTEFNFDAITDRLCEVALAMGLVSDTSDPEKASGLVVSQIKEWIKELQIPQNLSDFGVRADDIPSLAEAASKVTRLLNNNPKPMSVSDIENVYSKLLP